MGLEEAVFDRIPLDIIDISECNIRKTGKTRDIDQLKESIEEKGLLVPVTLIGPKQDGRYELIMGQRRFLAIKELGWPKIPAIILKEPPDRITKIEWSLSENIQVLEPLRKDFLEAFKTLYKEKYNSVSKIQKALGLSRSAAHDYVWLLDAPEDLISLIRPRGLPRTKAAEIVKYCFPNKKKMLELAKLYLSGRLTKEEKRRLLEVVKEMPKASLQLLEEEAKKPQELYKITILLPLEDYRRLENAATDIGFDREKMSELSEVVRFALKEWFNIRGY